MTDHTAEIRRLNDLARTRPATVNAIWVMTRGVAVLIAEGEDTPAALRAAATRATQLRAALASFADFSEDNDPYGEHDFGTLALFGARLFWKTGTVEHRVMPPRPYSDAGRGILRSTYSPKINHATSSATPPNRPAIKTIRCQGWRRMMMPPRALSAESVGWVAAIGTSKMGTAALRLRAPLPFAWRSLPCGSTHHRSVNGGTEASFRPAMFSDAGAAFWRSARH